jgi:tetratricopeptide (TPR) repeat protein
MSISVFLSTVSDEFRAYRDLLAHDLTRHNVAVKVQEDFKDLGGDTLAKLDVYIANCNAVVHLVGAMCGAAADEGQQRALLAKHDDLSTKLLPLAVDGLVKIALAEAEARAGDVDRALAILDEALATCDWSGHRPFDAALHRVRGEMLLKRDPANLFSAEQAFQTAIAVAKHQGTRSFELRAVLPLAKLYQSTGRLADAHAVLAPALEGFAPTPEMPEIAGAQALLERLA